jgi:hypothetical protein
VREGMLEEEEEILALGEILEEEATWSEEIGIKQEEANRIHHNADAAKMLFRRLLERTGRIKEESSILAVKMEPATFLRYLLVYLFRH